MSISPYTFRLANMADKDAIVQFMNTHWETRHPLVNRPEYFGYYYQGNGGLLRFALAEQDEKIAALAGYIPANQNETDLWVSLWAADKKAKGSGLELMAEIPSLTGCRSLSCNNIRPETRPFYEFLGFATGRMGHFYRLAEGKPYTLAKLTSISIPPVTGDVALLPIADAGSLLQSGFIPPSSANPHKDLWYLARRYFAFPHQQYNVYAALAPGSTIPGALLVTRTIQSQGSAVLRIVDYVGPSAWLPRMGNGINQLLHQANAEYADFYCAGLDAGLLSKAGFVERTEDDTNILPNYLTPPLFENTDYYYFTNLPQNFTMFKADGDQDRPNLPAT
ncbi:MAG: hypothetical protein ACK5JF_03460 [Oscillospiraceae bacterium]